MPTHLIGLNIFVGHTGDTPNDIECVTSAVKAASIHSDLFEISTLHWQKDSFSRFGEGSAQSIINKQLLSKSDAFVFILHSRMGELEGINKCGLVQELDFALNKKSLDDRIGISVFFKNTPLPYNTDPDGLKNLVRFKENCRGLGLYKEFNDAQELEAGVHAFLKSVQHSYANTGDLSVLNENLESDEINVSDDMGYLDHEVALEEGFKNATNYLLELNSIHEESGEKLSKFTDKLVYSNIAMMGAKQKLALYDEYSEILADLHRKANFDFEKFVTGLRGGMSSAFSLLSMAQPSEGEDVRKFIDVMLFTRESTESIMKGSIELRHSISQIPRLSKKSKQAWAAVDKFYENLIEEFKSSIGAIDRIIENFEINS